MSKKITALIPGAALALGIACIAKWLETVSYTHLTLPTKLEV